MTDSHSTQPLPHHVHIIGICGVLSSAIAGAFHAIGVKVTGSDKGFYPPVSTHLTELGITYYAGWHPEKMVAHGKPDVVIVATASGSKNPETLYAEEHGIPAISYTEIIKKYFVKKHSIVCAGTWGKTTTSTLLSYILEQAGFDPSYMFGGVSMSQKLSAKITSSDWSVLEGDEYKSGPNDPRAKFFSYHPTHLLLTAVSWDHADLYPTEATYIDAFRKLITMAKENALHHGGVIVSCSDNHLLSTILSEEHIRHVSYGKDGGAHYRYEHVIQSPEGLEFDIIHHGKKYHVTSPMLGAYNVENITGCFAMAHEIGVPVEKILRAIQDFVGIKRRLEKRISAHDSNREVTVIDTHAPTPEKAASGLQSIREIFPAPHGIVAIFEPNIGGRQRSSSRMYKGAFESANHVLIPRLTKLKIDPNATEQPIEGPELAQIISKDKAGVEYIEDDTQLIERALGHAKKGDVIVFLGSHGFRGMIEEAVAKLKK